MTPEEAAGLLTFEVKTTVTEDGQEVEKWVDHDGKLTTEETKLTLNEDFDFDEETKTFTLKLEELEAGEYTVIETDKDVDGNDVTVTYKVNGGDSQTGEETTAAVEGGKTTTVEFEDDYTKKAEAGKGNLELVKTIKGDITEEEANGALTFVVATKVTEDGTEVTKYLKADGTLSDTEVKLTLADFTHDEGSDEYILKLEDIELGNYTVTETTKDIDGKDVTVTYSVDGGEKTEGTETTAAVEDEKTTRVEFQNDYTKQTGTLELTKTIKGDITKEEAEGALTFIVATKVTEDGQEVTKYLDKNGDLVENEKDAVLTLKDFTYDEEADKYTLTIDKVDLGNYTVTETTKDLDGKEYTVKYSVNGEAQEEGSEAAATIEKDETTTVEFEDDFTNKPGILELTKTILGDITEEEAEGALTFVITTKVTEGGNEVTKYLKADGNPQRY